MKSGLQVSTRRASRSLWFAKRRRHRIEGEHRARASQKWRPATPRSLSRAR
jgi:hypothetical protein